MSDPFVFLLEERKAIVFLGDPFSIILGAEGGERAGGIARTGAGSEALDAAWERYGGGCSSRAASVGHGLPVGLANAAMRFAEELHLKAKRVVYGNSCCVGCGERGKGRASMGRRRCRWGRLTQRLDGVGMVDGSLEARFREDSDLQDLYRGVYERGISKRLRRSGCSVRRNRRRPRR